jgi:hypothetical protein
MVMTLVSTHVKTLHHAVSLTTRGSSGAAQKVHTPWPGRHPEPLHHRLAFDVGQLAQRWLDVFAGHVPTSFVVGYVRHEVDENGDPCTVFRSMPGYTVRGEYVEPMEGRVPGHHPLGTAWHENPTGLFYYNLAKTEWASEYRRRRRNGR